MIAISPGLHRDRPRHHPGDALGKPGDRGGRRMKRLNCRLCGRQEVWGILSSNAWGHTTTAKAASARRASPSTGTARSAKTRNHARSDVGHLRAPEPQSCGAPACRCLHVDRSARCTLCTCRDAHIDVADTARRWASRRRQPYLFQIIRTVSSTLDLDRVLAAIVDLVSEAIDCHAAFIYFVEPDGALTLRAVSDPYRALVGKLRFDPGEGLAGWVAEHDEPVFLADNALDDPRIKVVPEADEEKYQSFLAVPLRGKAGGVLGVIALHAVAPREFSEDDMDFLTYGASLVAGAIENARLYEDTRRRLALVEDMAALARTIAAAATLEELLPEVARRAHGLLEAEACQVFVLGSDGASLRLAGRWPPGAAAAAQLTAPGLAVELARHDGEPAGTRLASLVWPGHRDTVPLVTPLVSGEELLGFLAVRLGRSQAATPEKREVAALIAGQTAVAVQKAQLIDRLTERNAIKDFLEDLSRGAANEPAILDRARALGCDLRQPHLVLLAAPRSDAGPRWDEVCANLRVFGLSTLPRLRVRPPRRDSPRTGPRTARARAGGHQRPARSPRDVERQATIGNRPVEQVRRAHGLPDGIRRSRERPDRGRAGGVLSPASSVSTISAPTSTCSACRKTGASVTPAARRSGSSSSTTSGIAPNSCSRSRST